MRIMMLVCFLVCGCATYRSDVGVSSLDADFIRQLHARASLILDAASGTLSNLNGCKYCMMDWETKGQTDSACAIARDAAGGGSLMYLLEGGSPLGSWGSRRILWVITKQGQVYEGVRVILRREQEQPFVRTWQIGHDLVERKIVPLIDSVQQAFPDGVVEAGEPVDDMCCSILWDFSAKPPSPLIFLATSSPETDSLYVRLLDLMVARRK